MKIFKGERLGLILIAILIITFCIIASLRSCTPQRPTILPIANPTASANDSTCSDSLNKAKADTIIASSKSVKGKNEKKKKKARIKTASSSSKTTKTTKPKEEKKPIEPYQRDYLDEEL